MYKKPVQWFTTIICFFSIWLWSYAEVTAHKISLVDAVKIPGDLTLCGETVPWDLPQVRERFEKEMLLSLWDRPQVVLWLKRAPRYFPFIEQQLKAYGMPEDLKYLAVAESALRPHAGSPKGAMGFWQLMPQTGRKYGLTVDQFSDERRNLYLSTPAALAYLKALHAKFSTWSLSLAAYNMGEAGLASEIMEQDTRNYYDLYLPLETQRFIFRILSIKQIFTHPLDYGFEISAEEQYKPLNFDIVRIDNFKEVPIQLIAKASDTAFKTIKDLNPHLRGHYVQAGHFQINVPPGKSKGFNQRYAKLVAQYHKTRSQRIYVVRKGDSLSQIADKFEVPLASILIWNRLDLRRSIQPGDRLVIYPRRLSDVKP